MATCFASFEETAGCPTIAGSFSILNQYEQLRIAHFIIYIYITYYNILKNTSCCPRSPSNHPPKKQPSTGSQSSSPPSSESQLHDLRQRLPDDRCMTIAPAVAQAVADVEGLLLCFSVANGLMNSHGLRWAFGPWSIESGDSKEFGSQGSSPRIPSSQRSERGGSGPKKFTNK